MVFTLTRVFDGLAGGALYGLVGLAVMVTVRYGTGWNVAIASYAGLAAAAAIFLANRLDLPFLLTLPLGALAGAMAAIAIEAAILPLRRGPEAPMVIVLASVAAWLALGSLGDTLIGTSGVAFSQDSVPSTVYGSDTTMLRLLAVIDLAALAAATFALHYILTKTLYGTAMRAHGFDPLAAALGGVHPLRMMLKVAAIAGAIAGAAGVLAAASGAPVTMAVGVGLLWKGVAAALLGGGRVRRIALAGLLVGLAEVAGSDIWPQFWPLIPWQGAGAVLLLAIVLLRPRGLFPTDHMLGR